MRTYVGTKVVHARLITRGTANSVLGRHSAMLEDTTEPGYLVEYTDGGHPNVVGFAGYVSWSPKEVFERAYQLVGVGDLPVRLSWLDRAKAEYSELAGRRDKLDQYIKVGAWDKLDTYTKNDIHAQRMAMGAYLVALGRRIARAEKTCTADKPSL